MILIIYAMRFVNYKIYHAVTMCLELDIKIIEY